jgi:Ca-activated chloride channel family protein
MSGTLPVYSFGRTAVLTQCFCMTLFLGWVISSSAQAQDCIQCSTMTTSVPSQSEWLIRKQVNEVNVLFVAARHGRVAGELAQNDITVVDDNRPAAAILGFRTERDLPLRVGLVIDTSNSVTDRFRFEQAAASAFLRHALDREGDLAFVLGFNDFTRVTQDFVHDPDLLSRGVQELRLGGGTALYDAIAVASDKLRRRVESDIVARIIVVLTDGDNNSGTLSLNAAIDAAQQADVPVYAISTNYQETIFGRNLAAERSDADLRKLAEQTGGRLLRPGNVSDVPKAFGKIMEELRCRYAVSYRPADFVPDGHYRKIKIEARKNGEKFQIRARKGYFARTVPLAGVALAEAEESRSFPHPVQER